MEFRRLSDSSSGSCLRFAGIFGSEPLIVINESHRWKRRRFTAAHELKHALYDRGFDLSRSDKKTIDALERDANSFAANLLMPKRMIDALARSYGFVSIEMVSRLFGVSRQAAAYRLRNLGYVRFSYGDPLKDLLEMDKSLFRNVLFSEVPDDLSDWRMLQIVAAQSNLMHLHCLRCLQPSIDAYKEFCWGCGKSTLQY